MAKAWTDILASEINAESPVTEALVAKFHDNQEALITAQVDTRFAEGTTTSGTFQKVGEVKIYIPPGVATTDGDVMLVVSISVKVDSGTTGTARVQLVGGTAVDSGSITGTTYSEIELTISSTDVKANANSTVVLEIRLRRDTGTGTVYAKDEFGASRLERAA